MEVYVLVRQYSEWAADNHEYDRWQIVDVYASVERAVQASGGRDWTYSEDGAWSRGSYTLEDPDYVVGKFTVKT